MHFTKQNNFLHIYGAQMKQIPTLPKYDTWPSNIPIYIMTIWHFQHSPIECVSSEKEMLRENVFGIQF